MYNKILANKLYTRKLFKTYIFHRDNTEEEYYWDEYDTKNYYIIKRTIKHTNKPKQTEKQTEKLPPKTPKSLMCLPKPSVQIIKTNIPHKSDSSSQTQSSQTNKSTQTFNPVCDGSTQTFPKFYFPRHRSNLNVEPFNTN